jgi:hypothetical protein
MNNLHKKNKQNLLHPKKCNDFNDPSLLEAEETIKKAKFDSQPASNDFRESLKKKILDRRHKKNYMQNALKSVSRLFTVRRLAPVLSFVVIVGILVTTVHYWPGDENSPFGNFQKLIINSAYAMDNFEVTATQADSAGVDNDTSFIITSKEPLDAETLQANITLSPDVDFDFKAKSDTEFQITPKGDLNPKTVYNVVITASFASANGLSLIQKNYSWAFQVKDDFQILGTLPRDKGSYVPVNSGIEIVFSHSDFENFDNKFEITPSTEGNFEVHDQTLVFVPKSLQPATIYSVTVENGIKLKGSDKELESDYTFQFETDPKDQPRRGASLDLTTYSNYFGTSDEPVFQYYSHGIENDKELDVTVYKFQNENDFYSSLEARGEIPYWAGYSRDNFDFDRSNLEQFAQFTLDGIESDYKKYIMIPQKFPLGYYFVEVKKGDVTDVALMNISNISTYTEVTTTKTLLWVNDIDSKQAIDNARVDLIGHSATARTDASGVALLNTTDFTGDDNSIYYFRVANGSDSTVIEVSSNQYSPLYRFNDNGNSNDEYWMYFYEDKPIYHTTDTINFWGFVKDRNNIGIKEDVTVVLTKGSSYYYVSDPLYYAEQTVSLEGDNYTGKLDIKNLSAGYYSLQAKLGDKVLTSRSVQIADYSKPAYTLDVKSDKRAYFDGENATFETLVRFYDGTPMSELNLTYKYENETDKMKTDKNGTASVVLPAVFNKACTGQWCSISEDRNSITVDPDLGEVAEIQDRYSIRVFNSKLDINENSFKRLDDARVAIAGKVNNVDLDSYNSGDSDTHLGAPAENQTVLGQIKETHYIKTETGEKYDFINKRTYKTYKSERITTIIDEFVVLTSADGSFNYETNIQKSNDKSYQVHLKTFDENAKENSTINYLYDSRGTYFATGLSRYYQVVDKRVMQEDLYDFRYKLDETVNLVYLDGNNQRPEAETQQYLFAKLQKGMLDYNVQPNNEYSFEFKKEHMPNVYVQGVLFDGRTYHETGQGWWLAQFGYNARYDYSEKELDIELITDKKEYKPGEEVTATLVVKDINDKPVDAEVNLNIIDESIYALAGDYASPLHSLYLNVSSGRISSETTHKEMALGLDSGAEGGGCFATGTKILMADNSYKNIENIKVGDKVLTFAAETDRRLVESTVANTVEHLVSGYLLVNDYLKVTPEHRVFLNNTWTTAGLARVGDYFLDKDGDYVKIDTIVPVFGDVNVYNFEVENYHTYFADNLYVHNDKGGAQLRQVFEDSAIFHTAQTGGDGKAEITFTLPDNLTSWRLTAQAIRGDNLSAGLGTMNISATLPAFVNTVIANDYLVGDEPLIKTTAYGKDLNSTDEVELTLNSDSLDIDDLEINTTAFTPSYFKLGELSEGNHDLRFDLDSPAGEDAMLQTVAVNQSRLMESREDFYKVIDGLNVSGIKKGYATLTFSDENQGKFYNELLHLSSAYGDRLDQQLARVVSREILAKHFDKQYITSETINSAIYQTYEGAVTLLPYSSADLSLSARVAAISPEQIDQVALKRYFYGVLNNDIQSKTYETPNKTLVAYALYGLAGLNEPVLLKIQNFAQIEKLTLEDRLVIALAAYEIGDMALAEELFNDVMDEHSEDFEPMLRIKADSVDKMLQYSSYAAILAAGVSDERHDELWNYVDKYYTKDILIYLEKINYMQTAMKTLSPEPVSFKLKAGGKTYKEELEFGNTFRVSVSAEDLQTLEFSETSGQVGLVVSSNVPVTSADNNPSEEISIRREYYVKDVLTNNFKENDIIEVRLYPEISDDALGGLYQIIDFLPSGIRPITKVNWSSYFDKDHGGRKIYPTAINGQMVKTAVTKRFLKPYYYYNARVVSPGTYNAEPVLIQSFDSKGLKNWSDASRIVIEK